MKWFALTVNVLIVVWFAYASTLLVQNPGGPLPGIMGNRAVVLVMSVVPILLPVVSLLALRNYRGLTGARARLRKTGLVLNALLAFAIVVLWSVRAGYWLAGSYFAAGPTVVFTVAPLFVLTVLVNFVTLPMLKASDK